RISDAIAFEAGGAEQQLFAVVGRAPQLGQRQQFVFAERGVAPARLAEAAAPTTEALVRAVATLAGRRPGKD
ncbi:MAG: hypothetical protein M1457_01115, partial [bacterium]|nr:hypothetical protein [bacterium]